MCAFFGLDSFRSFAGSASRGGRGCSGEKDGLCAWLRGRSQAERCGCRRRTLEESAQRPSGAASAKVGNARGDEAKSIPGPNTLLLERDAVSTTTCAAPSPLSFVFYFFPLGVAPSFSVAKEEAGAAVSEDRTVAKRRRAERRKANASGATRFAVFSNKK